MKRYALWVEYCGSDYGGFQRLTARHLPLPRGSGSPRRWPRQKSVQEELECKLSVLLRHDVVLSQSGRTDQGVHATGQVVAFDTDSDIEPDRLVRTVNQMLDPAVRVLEIRRARLDFHPRFQAHRRRYQYFLWPGACSRSSPFWGGICWMLDESLNLAAMREAALPLLGRHDFSAYTRSPDPQSSRERELFRLDVREGVCAPRLGEGPLAQLRGLVCVEVEGNAFLRHMVRQLVGNLVEVGRGRWPVERPGQVLAAADPSRSASPAPAHGLFFVGVDYPPGCFME